jgi:hypothetical protein
MNFVDAERRRQHLCFMPWLLGMQGAVCQGELCAVAAAACQGIFWFCPWEPMDSESMKLAWLPGSIGVFRQILDFVLIQSP